MWAEKFQFLDLQINSVGVDKDERARVFELLFGFAKISSIPKGKPNTYRIEDVSGYVHAQTRQRSCSEAASCARCHVRFCSSNDILILELCWDIALWKKCGLKTKSHLLIQFLELMFMFLNPGN
ncbi:unnamed protein product [Lactuca virosa]|uniref:Uncharacterized protein n=1 Tax=Lactuca virosa TaxID=75947 RepID=A0AAU9P3U5_9ASTR|nr:unnamed protein product [Lactuca virosa]